MFDPPCSPFFSKTKQKKRKRPRRVFFYHPFFSLFFFKNIFFFFEFFLYFVEIHNTRANFEIGMYKSNVDLTIGNAFPLQKLKIKSTR